MVDERRKHPRLSIEVDVDVATENNFYAGKTHDISMGGIFVEMPVTPEVGTAIALKLQLGIRKYEVVARCAWILTSAGGAPVGFGAELVDLKPALKRVIAQFMTKRDPLSFEILEDDDGGREPAGPPPLPRGGGLPLSTRRSVSRRRATRPTMNRV
ncbi:MAG: PilZ domain-containing protein [Polyangiaceae bacterium]|nr:PilZ domain-containing protein [Polyangiaceae bacterium]